MKKKILVAALTVFIGTTLATGCAEADALGRQGHHVAAWGLGGAVVSLFCVFFVLLAEWVS